MPTVFLLNPSERNKTRKRGKVNMEKGKKSKARKAVAVKNPAPAKKRRKTVAAATSKGKRTYRRNPADRAGLMAVLFSALVGAGGALGVSAAWGRLGVIPVQLKEGIGGNVARSAVGVGAAFLLRKVIGAKASASLATGVLTVELAKAAADMAAKQGVSLGFWNPSQTIDGNGDYVRDEDTGEIMWQDASGALYRLPQNSGMGEVIPFRSGMGEVIDYASAGR